ncbi:anti-sigma factor [Flavobacterium sp. H122]|uniref:anti-sigma factor n=1 Tax=Flavobacterium sp. H122 TaxID=2529860 RepID=UPI0020C16BA0|nr:anti-sigma factor [Flavobacterium sp. H122]
MKYTDNNEFFKTENWDIEEPILGHEKRFLQKLGQQKPKQKRFPLRIVASIAFILGSAAMFLIINQKTTVQLSPETQKTQDYFTSVIEKELTELKSRETPENKKIINDALIQLEILEKDYKKLKIEIANKGENKQIIYALLTNMQTRISFIQSVMEQLEHINQLKNNQNENTL